jgi:diguanylate cyclase (GGDEF)-like protein
VIFVTAGFNPQEENACWEAGGVDFVSKPFNPNTIKHRVHAHSTLKLQADLLRKMVFVDGLTGVANRRYFDEALALEWSHCQREGAMLSVAMIDVDYFKHFNDAYGHQAGDDCLRRVAGAINVSLQRATDLAARYGGEEFACVFPRTDMIGAIGICKKIEAAVRALAVPHQDSDAAAVVTVSIGVASAKPGEGGTASDLVSQADAALYVAKQGGRARVYPAN